MGLRSVLPREWRRALLYGLELALGTTALQWLDWSRFDRPATDDVFPAVIAVAFLALGVFAEWRLSRPTPSLRPRDTAPRTMLGISPREMEVLEALARGLTTKEIAGVLGVSPNTVKTHTSRLFEKLPATNRTGATARARELGLLP